jgi:DHA2 family multidrug resistance protein
MYTGGIVMGRIGLRTALGVGAAIFAAGMYFWTIRLTPSISDQQMYLPLAVTGFGAGWEIGPISYLITSEIPAPLLGEAMELYLFQRQLGGSWGIAILTILVDRRRSFWSAHLGEHFNVYNLAAQDALRQSAMLLRASGLSEPQASDGAMGILHGRLLIQSTVNAFADTFAYQTAVGLFALLLIVFLSRGKTLVNAFRWIVAMVR